MRKSGKSKWILRIGIIFLITVVAIVVAGNWFISSLFSRNEIVAQLEKNLNARVEIASIDFSIAPPSMDLRGLKIAKRGPAELHAIAHDDREPVTNPELEMARVKVALGLAEIFQRRLEVHQFDIVGLKAKMTIYENGGHSLEPLLKSPTADDSSQLADQTPAAEKVAEKPAEPTVSVADDEVFDAQQHERFIAALNSMSLKDAQLEIIYEKSDLKVNVSELNLRLHDLKIDPADLITSNEAKLSMAGMVDMYSVKGIHYTHIGLDGPGVVALFNPKTGALEPKVDIDFAIADESFINADVPVVNQAWAKLDFLKDWGVSFGSLPERASFGRSKSLSVAYHLGKVTIKKPISIWYGDWEVALLGNAWLQTGNYNHDAMLEILAAERLSQKTLKEATKLAEYVPNDGKEKVIKEITDNWYRGERLVAQLHSKGDLSKPDVDLLNKKPDIQGAVEDAVKDQLKKKGGKLLEGLLGR
ncbi:hypothetical protein [Persicirhabdus sediminis]|uniref:AsmA protein n=1 Tax=Persicirhabdus sediminis TaxID=454144 RepID=A0A8J7MDZ6_9BACT|nr:hypothetical protein [Persicirhabdus sediminis]MBK1790925.1 hypothetical protein [Persicirhabdus sediminis]